jgi:hypothetical protein
VKPGKGKQKGNAFEIVVAKELGDWFYDNRNALWRQQDSGARATLWGGGDGPWPGDVAPVLPVAMNFPLCVECKDRKQWTFDDVLRKGKHSHLLEWYDKAVTDAADYALLPWLVFRKNYHPIYVAMGTGHRSTRAILKQVPYLRFMDYDAYDLGIVLLDELREAFPRNFVAKLRRWESMEEGSDPAAC